MDEKTAENDHFSSVYSGCDFDEIAVRISGEEAFSRASNRREMEAGRPSAFDADDVKRALSFDPEPLDVEGFMALLSPAADPFLETMARRANEITRRRFGRTVQLYAPLYLSNECRSSCTYCGFSYENKIRRRTLTLDEIRNEAKVLHAQGIRHILLLTGEDYRNTSLAYIAQAAKTLSDDFASIGIEVYPLKRDEYSLLRENGVDALTVYQETYDPVRYREVHLRGVKQKMLYRLDAPDRAGEAAFRRIQIGALLGLSDPAAEVFFVGIHAKHLLKRYWKTQINVALPRLRSAAGFESVPGIPDRMFVRFLVALRLFLPDAGIVLSTRESARFRDSMAGICVTTMSAGSRTDPGGYSGLESERQFEIDDARSVGEIVTALRNQNLDPVFVDWACEMK